MEKPKTGKPLLMPGVSQKMMSSTFWTTRFRDLGLAEDWIGNYKLTLEMSFQTYLTNVNSSLKKLHSEDSDPLELEKIVTGINCWERPEYGLIVELGDLKLLPTTRPLFSKEGETDLDRNQLSSLDPGDQVILFGMSADGKWLAAVSGAGVGWIKRKQVGVGTRKEIEDYLNEPDRLITIDPRVKILSNDGFTEVSMGCSFPLNDHLRHTVVVPKRNSEGKLSFKTSAIVGGTVRDHLPKSAHHLLRQAFKYLGYRYAWGDRDREGAGLDCSRLVRDVLRSLGFNPPRNSRDQLAVGKRKLRMEGLNITERFSLLHKVSPGSLLFTPGHVMFFLGEYQGEVYAIHALNNYRRIVDNKEEPVPVKQVVVSGLSLGAGTDNGSLLEQITEVIEV